MTLVSCVIPVRNEAGTIAAAVESCLSQTFNGDLEVVVADGMSDDGTREIVSRISAGDERVRMVDNPKRVTPAALNVAIEDADGDIIARVDAHSVLPPGYVATAVRLLEETGAANVGGVQRAVGDRLWQRAIALAMSSPIGVGDARFHYGGDPGPTDTVYLGVFRRDAIAAVGLFDESLIRNQDYELNHRLRVAGETVWFDPALEVDYRPRSSIAGLWRQYADYGRGKRLMLRKHSDALRLRQLAPPALLTGLAVSTALALFGRRRLALVVPTAYAAAVVTFAAQALRSTGDVAALVMPVPVVTMHVAWGVGFLTVRPLRV